MTMLETTRAEHPQSSAEPTLQVKKHRVEGEAFHKAGKHQEAVDTRAKAMGIPGVR